MKISADDLLDIMAVASNRIHRELKNAYTSGHLKEYLQKIDRCCTKSIGRRSGAWFGKELPDSA